METDNTDGQKGKQPGAAHVVKVGRISGMIFKNKSKEGEWYSITLARHYKDPQGVWRTAQSFGRDDMLVVAEVARMCWHWVAGQTDL